jgi:cell division transport system permease protein
MVLQRCGSFPHAEARALADSMAGRRGVTAGLPVPDLIDLEIVPGARIDPTLLRAQPRRDRSRMSTVDDHRAWLSALIDPCPNSRNSRLCHSRSLIAAAAVIAVIFTTRSGLAVHSGDHRTAPPDGRAGTPISRGQFQLQALMLAHCAAVLPAVSVRPWRSCSCFGWIGPRDRCSIPARIVAFAHSAGSSCLLVPAGAVAIAMLTARLTVLRALARMP